MARKYKYAYVVIERASNMCVQTLKTNNAKFAVDNDAHFSFGVAVDIASELLGKYYYNSQWWERVWSELDEFGNPVEGATYTDIPFAVDGEE